MSSASKGDLKMANESASAPNMSASANDEKQEDLFVEYCVGKRIHFVEVGKIRPFIAALHVDNLHGPGGRITPRKILKRGKMGVWIECSDIYIAEETLTLSQFAKKESIVATGSDPKVTDVRDQVIKAVLLKALVKGAAPSVAMCMLLENGKVIYSQSGSWDVEWVPNHTVV
jgi:hypothetical protein